MEQVFDVAVIGGGINGTGIAADAALRGLSVMLCEQGDLASQTSSKSSKLVHGGLRYLEHFDFSLVKKALTEREKLLQLAPHLVHPMPFVIPYQKERRPLWMLRAGLFIYDHLNRKNSLKRSCTIRRAQQPACFKPLITSIHRGLLFYDCSTDDARLTIANACQAKEHGATIMPHTKLIDATVINGIWHLTLKDKQANLSQMMTKTIVNAAGPWVNSIDALLQVPTPHPLALVQGSHVVVPKLYEGEHAYLLQHADKRIVFVMPFHDYTLIGTTDVPFTGALSEALHISTDEINYLFALIKQYFNQQLQQQDIITSWSGIRTLLANEHKTASALSRDYSYDISHHPAPVLSVYSGKITTYRQLAAQVVDELRVLFPDLPPSLTDSTPLPGATLDAMCFSDYQALASKKYYWLTPEILHHYLATYGTRTEQILVTCTQMPDLGRHFGAVLYQAEVDYLVREEWAQSCDDILWRRTKLGLTLKQQNINRLKAYLYETYNLEARI